MKQILILLFIFCTISLFSEKTKIAIIDFSAKGEIENENYLADAVVENLITSFIDSGEFIVIERNMLKGIMRELQLQNSDDFNDELRNKIGNLYSADLVILGSLTKIGSRYTINVRGVEVETGVGKFAKNLSTNSKESLVDLIPQIVSLITGKEVIMDMVNKSNNEDSKEEKFDNQSYKPSITLEKQSFSPGENIKLKFSASPNYANNAWIGIIPSHINHGIESINDQHDISYQYLNKRVSGVLTFYAPSDIGNYDFRMHDTDNNGNEVFSAGFKVESNKNVSSQLKITTSKNKYKKNEPVIVKWSGLPGNEFDWITIVKSNASPNSYNEWFYTKGKIEGTYTFKPLLPGEYEVRIFFNWPSGKYIIQAKYLFKVVDR